MKMLLTKCKDSNQDFELGLLNFRNTPSEGMTASPAQRFFGRHTKTLLPTKFNVLNENFDRKTIHEQIIEK